MENRHLPRHSHIHETDNEQMWNNHLSDSRVNSGNGSLLLPADLTVHDLNSMTYPNSGPGTNVIPLPNHRPEVPSLMIDNTGTSYDPCMYPTTGTCSHFPSHHAQQNTCYNHVGVREVGVAHNRQMDYERAAYKRKGPAISDVERGNISAYHCVGSSSNHSSSAEHLKTEDILGPQYCPSDLLDIGPSYRSNNMLVPDDGFQRNVRSRHGNALHPGISSANHSSSNMSHDFQSGEYNSGHVVAEQWNHSSSLVSHTASTSSEISSFAYEVDHSRGGNFDHNGRVEVSGGYQSSFPHRSLTHLPTFSVGSTRGAMVGRGSYNQRAAYRTHAGYPSMRLAGNLEDPRLHGNEDIPRYSRPLHIVGRGFERNVRVRNRYDRFSFSDESARARWVSEGVAMMDRSTYYDSRNLFDQHQDMRLDIDNMSYEELLALEDRIGYVSTGLSEDAMSRCLIETIYCSSDRILEGCEEEKCAICLESYKDGEYMSRLKCRHDFHASCIKKWLLIKNICPICKGSALEENSKGQ